VLLKEAGLGAALNALGEDRPVSVQLASVRRYPDVIESSVYLLVARMSESGPTTVAISDDGHHLNSLVHTNGRPGDLLDIADRVKTLDGDLNITVTGNEVVANLVLPYAA
jgi:hypothetical protein